MVHLLMSANEFDLDHPDWGGWSGRYSREKSINVWSKHADVRASEQASASFAVRGDAADTWADPDSGDRHEQSLFAPVWRWRQAFFNDFVARVDWCVKPFAEANHNPVAAIRGDLTRTIVRIAARPGETVALDALVTTDPDGIRSPIE